MAARCAEEERLLDAVLDDDRTSYFQNNSPALVQRYVLGLEDGRTLIRAAWVSRELHLGQPSAFLQRP